MPRYSPVIEAFANDRESNAIEKAEITNLRDAIGFSAGRSKIP
jgi:hypothetical protein